MCIQWDHVVFSIDWELVSGQALEGEMGASCVDKKRKIAPGIGDRKCQGHKAGGFLWSSNRRIQLTGVENAERHCEMREMPSPQSFRKDVSIFTAMWLPFLNKALFVSSVP